MADTAVIPADGIAAERPAARWRLPLLLAVPIMLILVALYFYLSGGRYQSTDNAEVQAGLVGIAADISGRVVEIDIQENQMVKAGEVLFRIDAAAPQANVDAAAAALAAARAGVDARRADYHRSLSDQQGAQARLAFAQGEVARQKQLVAEGISSRAQYDQAVTTAATARDALSASAAQIEGNRAQLAGRISGPSDSLPAVRQAAAALENARIALDHTIVRAPKDGIVTRVNQFQLGSYVTALRPVFTLAGTHFWVEANFKENQLRYMRVGQPATVSIDAYSDVKLTGHVASFSPGTGNSFSVLPAENATGNWVKVVQRLPVEIDFDHIPAGLPLHAGLSTEVEVDTGHQRRLFNTSAAASGDPER